MEGGRKGGREGGREGGSERVGVRERERMHETINRREEKESWLELSENHSTFLLLSFSILLSKASLSIWPHPSSHCFQACHDSPSPSSSLQGLMTIKSVSRTAGQCMGEELDRDDELNASLLCFNSTFWICGHKWRDNRR